MSDNEPPDLPTVNSHNEAGKVPIAIRPGSLLGGIGLAWLIMVVGEPSAFLLANVIGIVSVYFPPLAIIVTGVTLLFRTGSRTGTGLLLGLVSVVAVSVLLAAACFGLFYRGHLGNMH